MLQNLVLALLRHQKNHHQNLVGAVRLHHRQKDHQVLEEQVQ
jgi:hypothetical protein